MSGPPPRIEAVGLAKSFDGRRAVEGLTFAIPPGEIFALLGPNGSGKTTTVRLLNGVLAPDAGEARLDGVRAAEDPAAVHTRSGVMTETAGLYENLSGEENLGFFGAVHGMEAGDAKRRARHLLEVLELSDAAGRKVKTYSTGMKKRLSLARAMLHRPAALFLDEPTSGLDPEGARAVTELVRRLASEEGTTVFLCTHQLKYAEEITTLYGFIHEGRMLGFGRFDALARAMGAAARLELRAEGVPPALSGRPHDSDGRILRFDIAGDDDAARILGAVVAAGGRIYEARQTRMSLEDLYFAYRRRAETADGGTATTSGAASGAGRRTSLTSEAEGGVS